MFNSVKKSLSEMLGSDYTESVANALNAFKIMTKEDAMKIADEKIDFYSQERQSINDELLARVGEEIIPSYNGGSNGAPTDSFGKAANNAAAPITGIANYRVGEDGRLYLIGKSEHYHASMGHRFEGYRLIDNARKLGILNATHNNTRGHITRLLERTIVADINGISVQDGQALEEILASKAPKVLNRVINLETGSVAVEAGIKMMLSRFYRLEKNNDKPKYDGKIPVFLVMADSEGGKESNYHGTSVIAQTFRGLWPEYYEKIENAEIYKVVSVDINDSDNFKKVIENYNNEKYKTAGFLHEIVMMNYGGILLTKAFLNAAYEACAASDTPTLVDEIQSCMWYDGMLLFRLYDLKPDFAVLGKGFPGGEYPASKIITTAEMDSLSQFGALVTNGQEELASLSYLITMAFARENAKNIVKLGERFESAMRKLYEKHSDVIAKVEGLGHLMSLHFLTVDKAAAFAKKINSMCIDTSAQLYKANCPPAVLFKPPLIATEATLDYITEKLDDALVEMKS